MFTSTLPQPVSTEAVNSVTDLQCAVCQNDINAYIFVALTTPSLQDGTCRDGLHCSKWRQLKVRLNLQRRRRVDNKIPPSTVFQFVSANFSFSAGRLLHSLGEEFVWYSHPHCQLPRREIVRRAKSVTCCHVLYVLKHTQRWHQRWILRKTVCQLYICEWTFGFWKKKMLEMSWLAEEPLAVYRFLYFVELYVNVIPDWDERKIRAFRQVLPTYGIGLIHTAGRAELSWTGPSEWQFTLQGEPTRTESSAADSSELPGCQTKCMYFH